MATPSAVDTLHAILHDDPPPIDASPHVGPDLATVMRERCFEHPAERTPNGRSGTPKPSRAPAAAGGSSTRAELGELRNCSRPSPSLPFCVPERRGRQQGTFAGLRGCAHYDLRQPGGCARRADLGDSGPATPQAPNLRALAREAARSLQLAGHRPETRSGLARVDAAVRRRPRRSSRCPRNMISCWKTCSRSRTKLDAGS